MLVTPRFQLNLMIDDSSEQRKQIYSLNNQTNKIVLNPSYLHPSNNNNNTATTTETNTEKSTTDNNKRENKELENLKKGKIVMIGSNSKEEEMTYSQSTTYDGKNIHNRSETSITLGPNSSIVKVKNNEETSSVFSEFDEKVVKDIISDTLRRKLQGHTYDHEHYREESAAISSEIHDRLKHICQSEIYKLSVNVFIGEIRGEGVETATLCSWNPKNDCVVYGYYTNSSVFGIGTVYASYHP